MACAPRCAAKSSPVWTTISRGQAYGVINLLNTFKVRADWSVGFLAQQVEVQCTALNQVRQLLQGVPDAPALPEQQAPTPTCAQDLSDLRDAHNRRIGDVLQWLFQHRAGLTPDTARQIEQCLRQSMHAEIEIELKHSPRPLFAEMSNAGKES